MNWYKLLMLVLMVLVALVALIMAAARKDSTLIEKLGQIWAKNDGRWVWVRHRSKYQGQWLEGQGVVDSKQEAASKVVEGWYVEER